MTDEESISELRQLFREARVVFTHASDHIVGLFEGTWQQAENLSEDLAVERNLHEVVDFNERYAIERDIESAVAFFWKLPPAFLVIQVALLEDCLLSICQAAAQIKGSALEEPDHFTMEQAIAFLQKDLGVAFPQPWPAWDKIKGIQSRRNDLLNRTGLGAESEGLTDRSLVDVNKTILSFLEELQGFMLTHLG